VHKFINSIVVIFNDFFNVKRVFRKAAKKLQMTFLSTVGDLKKKKLYTLQEALEKPFSAPMQSSRTQRFRENVKIIKHFA
jgi:hypothetical protein